MNEDLYIGETVTFLGNRAKILSYDKTRGAFLVNDGRLIFELNEEFLYKNGEIKRLSEKNDLVNQVRRNNFTRPQA